MNTTLRMMWMVSAMSLGLYACGESEAPAEQPATEEPGPEAALAEDPGADPAEEPAAEGPVAEPNAEELPIAEDFEEEMAEAITAENYNDALAQIEAELAEVGSTE